MKQFRRLWMHAGQPAILYVIGFAVIGGMLFFRLGTLVKPFTPAELTARNSTISLQQITDNPVNGPHKLSQHMLQKSGRKGPLAMRGVSALFGLLSVVLFFFVARTMFTSRIAFLGAVILATSSYFLHTARAATPDIVLMTALLSLMACGVWLRHTSKRSFFFLPSVMVVTAICLYIPGMVWYIVLFLLLQRKAISRELRQTSAIVIILTFFGSLILLTPLALASISDPSLLELLAGLPADMPTWTQLGRNVAIIPVRLFIKGPLDAGTWLGRLPILDIFTSVMLILGSYRLLFFQYKLDRTRLLACSILGAALLIALGGFITITVLMPLAYIIILCGIAQYLYQWYSVFPRNPFARNIGLFLLSSGIVLSIYYNSNRYFVAWPNTPASRQAHNQNP